MNATVHVHTTPTAVQRKHLDVKDEALSTVLELIAIVRDVAAGVEDLVDLAVDWAMFL